MQKEKNYGWALDSARKNPYNSCVAHPGVAQLVARMVRDHEAVGSNPATRTNEETAEPQWFCGFSCISAGLRAFSALRRLPQLAT